MFKIEPTALYSLADLEESLGDAITVRQFLDETRPAKRYKALWLGQDLLDAIHAKEPLNESRPAFVTTKPRGRRNGNISLTQKKHLTPRDSLLQH